MTKYVILLLGVICVSCTNEPVAPEQEKSYVDLSLPIYIENSEVITRSQDEAPLQDINIFIYDDSGLSYENYLTAESVINLKLPPRIFRCYVIANYGRRINGGTEEQLERMAVEHGWNEKEVLYTAREVIDLRGQSGSGTIKSIAVRRAGALIDFRIYTLPSLAGLAIERVRICNIPTVTGCFNEPENNRYIDTPWDDKAIMSYDRAEGSFWMAENLGGVNESITEQKNKSERNAPANSTFIHIKARYQGKDCYFRVYLGQNNTSDFNVRRNTYHCLEITINSINSVDTRISHSLVHFEYDTEEIYFGPEEELLIQLTGICHTEDLEYKVEFLMLEGQAGCYSINGIQVGRHHPIELQNNRAKIRVGRWSLAVSNRDDLLRFIIRITDKYGFARQQEFTMHFGLAIIIESYYTGPNANMGSYIVSKDPLSIKHDTRGLISSHTHIYHIDEGVSITACAWEGNIFRGWLRGVESGEYCSLDNTIYIDKTNVLPRYGLAFHPE